MTTLLDRRAGNPPALRRLLCLLAVGACSSAADGPAPPPGTVAVASVSVSPASTNLYLGQTAQLAATTRDASGNTLAGRTVSWSAAPTSVATVSSNGLVTAVAAGTATVTATSEGQSGTASVTAALVPVATVTVAPAAFTLNPGQTQQLSATTKDSAGGTLTGRSVTWSASPTSVATVSTGGLVTAVAVGSATITATSESRNGTATATVAAAGGSPECAAPQPSWIWCDDFESDRLASYFEVENPTGTFQRMSGVGRNGTFGMRARWTVGQTEAGGLHLAFGKTPQTYMRPVDAGTALYRDIYWRFYLRLQPGWTGGGADKLTRAHIFASSTSFAQALAAHIWSGTGATINVLELDPASGTDAAGTLQTTTYNDAARFRWLGLVSGTNQIFASANAGNWVCVEAHVKLNDAGLSNGVFELWLNGTLDAQRTGMNWVGAFSAYGINAIYFENFWNAGSPAIQERYFDNIVVATQRIGC